MRNSSSKICRENQNTLVLFSSFFVRNRAFCDLMSRNLVEPERPKLAIWRRVASWISKATCSQVYASARAPTHTHTYFCVCVCVCVSVGARALAYACAIVASLVKHATRRHFVIFGLYVSTV